MKEKDSRVGILAGDSSIVCAVVEGGLSSMHEEASLQNDLTTCRR